MQVCTSAPMLSFALASFGNNKFTVRICRTTLLMHRGTCDVSPFLSSMLSSIMQHMPVRLQLAYVLSTLAALVLPGISGLPNKDVSVSTLSTAAGRPQVAQGYQFIKNS